MTFAQAHVGARHPSPGHGLGDYRADVRLLLLAAMALVAGSGGAFAAWALVHLIGLVTNLVWFGVLDTASRPMSMASRGPWMIVAPMLGGLAIGLMARFGSEKIRGHGIPEAIEAILIGGSRMSPKVAVLKPISSAISIGTGGPFGAEGPIIMTGGAIGSLFAQLFHLSAAERKTLLVAGAAAGMTGIFGTPVAAILLAVELLLFEWRPRSFVPVVTAASVAIGWRPLLFGSGPLFPFTDAARLSPVGLLGALIVGLAAGLLATVLTKLLYAMEDGFERLPVHWMWWPALGGLVVGVGGLFEPRALGVGYDVIVDLLTGRLLVEAVLLILAVKAAIWLVALSSGTSGGVLAPLLIMGGAAGSLIGLLLPGPLGLWALLGMAAMLGGTMRAPLTGAVFAVELTGDMNQLPLLIAATTTAYAVTVLLLRRSMLTEKIARRGQHITREYSVDPYELTRVGEIMARDVDTLPADLSLEKTMHILEAGRHRAYPVLDANDAPVGMVSRADALAWQQEDLAREETVGERVSDASLPMLHPSDVVARAVDLMLSSDQGRIVVTDPASGVLVGLVTRKDLLRVRAGVAASERERRAYLRSPSIRIGREVSASTSDRDERRIAGMTEDEFEAIMPRVLQSFYTRVRTDERIGPIFNAAVEDWDEHLDRIGQFWSSVMLGSGRYKGNPVARHLPHAAQIDEAAFARWLALWRETTDAMLPPEFAAPLQQKAARIAESLHLAIQFASQSQRALMTRPS